ncbi:fam-l protein [Plasmodium malariae]|uniref:Fam-l protein n=1 Tax=Plasmodium malariae TaxID=5858 RepID=A0A1D3JH38_PLAMA|nr:fam-l protein [Plasmodium malariae]SBT85519.1 fam-l protein [Plasmodium malariae]
MEEKIKSLLFIEIITFILLSWMYFIHMSEFTKYSNDNHNLIIKLGERNCRILAKCRKDKYSDIVNLNEKLYNNGENKKDNISYNEKYATVKKEQSNGSSKNNALKNKEIIKIKSCIFETKKCSHLEKRIFKELDYVNFLKNNRSISNKLYKKIIRKKYELRFLVPVLFLFLLLVSLILDLFVGCGLQNIFFDVMRKLSLTEWIKTLNTWLSIEPLRELYKITKSIDSSSKKTYSTLVTNFFGIIIYILPFLILGVIAILKVFYHHKKFKKYEKIKFRKR